MRRRTGVWCPKHWEHLWGMMEAGAAVDITFLEMGLAYLAARAVVPIRHICCKVEGNILNAMIERADSSRWEHYVRDIKAREAPLTPFQEQELGQWHL